jgi:protein phosphatase
MAPDRHLVQPDRRLALTVGGHHLASVRGKRDEQQDAAVVCDHLWAVADGMGGHPAGAAAARTALDALTRTVTAPGGPADLAAGFAAAQTAVAGLATGGWRNPGTTLVAVLADPAGDRVHVAWVGDSRAYLVDAGNGVTQLTVDHTDFGWGLDRALGDHGPDIGAEPDHVTVPAGDGNLLLLTSDGVHGPVDVHDGDEVRLAVVEAAQLLAVVEAAAEAGTDNATAVLVDLSRIRHTAPVTQRR